MPLIERTCWRAPSTAFAPNCASLDSSERASRLRGKVKNSRNRRSMDRCWICPPVSHRDSVASASPKRAPPGFRSVDDQNCRQIRIVVFEDHLHKQRPTQTLDRNKRLVVGASLRSSLTPSGVNRSPRERSRTRCAPCCCHSQQPLTDRPNVMPRFTSSNSIGSSGAAIRGSVT